ncbi:MAG: copper chaperone PCu(A)C [Alphaproteobacteria bacterium]
MFDDETLSLSIAIGTALLMITIIVGTVGASSRVEEPGPLIAVSGGWASATIGAGKTSAGYLVIENRSGRADRLVAASADGISNVELHMNVIEGGMARMRPVDGIPLRDGKATALEPGGFHLMFMGLDAPLQDGDTVDLTLTFENAEPQTVTLPVRRRGRGRDAMPHGDHSDGAEKGQTPAEDHGSH